MCRDNASLPCFPPPPNCPTQHNTRNAEPQKHQPQQASPPPRSHLLHLALPYVPLGGRLTQRLHAPHSIQLAAQPLRGGGGGGGGGAGRARGDGQANWQAGGRASRTASGALPRCKQPAFGPRRHPRAPAAAVLAAAALPRAQWGQWHASSAAGGGGGGEGAATAATVGKVKVREQAQPVISRAGAAARTIVSLPTATIRRPRHRPTAVTRPLHCPPTCSAVSSRSSPALMVRISFLACVCTAARSPIASRFQVIALMPTKA